MPYLPPIEDYYRKAEDQLLASLPTGPIWNGDNFINLLKALSRAYARAERESDRHVQFEIHPESTFDLLTDWEQALGLPLEGGDFDNQSLSQRRDEISYWLRPVSSYTKDEIKNVYEQYRYDVANVERVEPFSVNSAVTTALYDERWDYVIDLLLESVPGHIVEGENIDYTELRAIAKRIFPIPFAPFVRESDSILPPGSPVNVKATPMGEAVLLEWINTSTKFAYVLIEVEHPTGTHDTVLYRTLNTETIRYLVSDLTPGLDTRFNLWSVRADGARSAPVAVTAKPLDTAPPLQVPYNTIRSVSSAARIQLSWDLHNREDIVETTVSAIRSDGTDASIADAVVPVGAEQTAIFSNLDDVSDPVAYTFSFVTTDAAGNDSDPVDYEAWTIENVLPPLQDVEADMRPAEIEFSWRYPVDVEPSFKPVIVGDAVSGDLIIDDIPAGSTRYILEYSDLPMSAIDQDVSYRIYWSNGRGLVSTSVTVVASMHDAMPPSAPTSPTHIDAESQGSSGYRTFTVSVPDDASISHIEVIQFSRTDQGNVADPTSAEEMGASIQAVDATPGTTVKFTVRVEQTGRYYIGVRSVDKVDLKSDWLGVTASSDRLYNFTGAYTPSIGAIGPPSNFRINDTDGRRLLWSAPSVGAASVTGYEISTKEDFSTTADGRSVTQSVSITSTAATSYTFDADNYQIGVEYPLWFRSRSSSGVSYAVPYTVVLEDTVAPAAPEILRIRKVGNGFQVQWTDPDADDLSHWKLSLNQNGAVIFDNDADGFTQVGAYIDDGVQLVGSDIFEADNTMDPIGVSVKYWDIYDNEGTTKSITYNQSDTTSPSKPALSSKSVNSSGQKLNVAWTYTTGNAPSSNDVQSITIYESDENDNKFSKVVDSYLMPSTAVSYTSPDLPYSKRYIVELSIADLAGNISEANVFDTYHHTDSSAPAAVESFNLIAADNSTARASWEVPADVPDLSHFLVQYAVQSSTPDASDYTDEQISLVSGQATYVWNKQVATGNTIWVRVATADVSGNETFNAPSSITPSEHGPGIPLNVTYATDANAGSVTFKWVEPTATFFGSAADFDHIRIEATSGGVAVTGSPFDAGSGVSAYTVTGLSKNIEYVFKLYGVDSADDVSDLYVEQTLTIADNAAPSPPTNVNLVLPAGETVKLFWDNPADADFAGTRIRYYPTAKPEVSSVLQLSATDEEVYIYNLDATIEYTFNIQSRDNVSNYSDPVTVTGTPTA